MNTSESDSSQPAASRLQVELGAKPARRFKTLWLVLLLVLIAAVTGATLIGVSPSSFSPTPSPWPSAAPQTSSSTQARIAWSANPIEVILSPGETASRTLTFTSTRNLDEISVQVVPGLAGFVKVCVPANDGETIQRVQPDCQNGLFGVKANKPQTVRLSFVVPSGTTLGTYEGTIHIRLGSQ